MLILRCLYRKYKFDVCQVTFQVAILALTPSQIEAISGSDDIVEYVNSFPKFRDMLEKDMS